MNKKRINIIFIILIYLFIYLIFKENTSLSNITFLSFKMYILKVFPFLFIMMILNNLLLKCNFPYYFNKIFKSDKLYIFINSILSGSPINAILIKNYLDNNCINEDNASKLLCFTSFNNPLFLYNYLMLILNNINNVIKIMGVIYFTNIVIFLYCKNKIKINTLVKYQNYNLKKELFNIISESTFNMIKIMGIIIFFKIILDLVMTKNNVLIYLLKGLIEVTSGLNTLTLINTKVIIKEIISYIIISFMGFSIHMQISTILENYNINYKYFYLSRLFLIILGIIIILIL